MITRLALTFASVVALAGCTDADWQGATSFVGFSDAPARPAPVRTVAASPVRRPAPPAALAQAAPTDPFCQDVAMQDSRGNDFDPATQRSVYLRSYQQCVAMFSGTAPQ